MCPQHETKIFFEDQNFDKGDSRQNIFNLLNDPSKCGGDEGKRQTDRWKLCNKRLENAALNLKFRWLYL